MAARSMTGFGKAEASAGRRKITVEIRSLNSKQLDLSLRMPSAFRIADAEVRAAAARVMQRGKVDIYIGIDAGEGGTTGCGCSGRAVAINEALFATYYRQLVALGEANGTEWESGALLRSVLRMPDVVAGETEEAVCEEDLAALMTAVAGALEHIDTFRLTEGAILMSDVLGHIAVIERLLGEVAPFERARVETIKARIRESIEKVGVAVDSNRLEQEMIYYVEKLDVTEEKVRLANHCAYFREVAASEEAPGRKLGFIAQEIGREINTLGSKANDASIQRIVVGMKDELEKIKEQLLNIL